MSQPTTNGSAPLFDPERLLRAYETARDDLLSECTQRGHWVGELSSSALSTATAVSALSLVERHADVGRDGNPAAKSAIDSVQIEIISELVCNGLQWLADHQNPDGGWGDTDKSNSNIATTMLVRAAFHLTAVPAHHDNLLQRADDYIKKEGGVAGLRKRFGKDKTFAVPILTNCALAELVPWSEVSPLPFELACFSHSTYRYLRLPVVSYAIPALVAVGQARYWHRKPRNPITRILRHFARKPSLRRLKSMQPESGGFLEATPLTSFVVMSLASMNLTSHPVVLRGVQFLVDSVRDDGSWPIDTNLATWVTTLSINALAAGGENV
ncbi:MAG: prenyltransferase/squalene oxidase repeat-containing protein, partial [Pirellulales bacterium]